ncbi:hypothetical protein BT69DRAFT_374551 [Atractiella rhizophila]|nr:hypothetical protein BT69DRAFT_374551 [Atractiella rhizophila]
MPFATTTSDGRNYDSTPIDPIYLMERYPTEFPPYLEILEVKWRVKSNRFPKLLKTWSILLHSFELSSKLKRLTLSLGPPPKESQRKRILIAISNLPNLKILLMWNKIETGQTRWTTADLAILLEQEIRFEFLQLTGWDLLSSADFSRCKLPANFNGLSLDGCRLSLPVFRQFYPFVAPHAGKARNRDDMNYLSLNTFAPNRLNPEQVLPLVAEMTVSLHMLIITHWLHEKDNLNRQIILSNPLDEGFLTFHNLRRLILDGTNETSNLVSPHFLQRLSCPSLTLLSVACCYFVHEDIHSFLSSRSRFVADRSTKFWFSWTALWGDMATTELVQDLLQVDGTKRGEEIVLEPWRDGEEGDWIFDGKDFKVTFNEGGEYSPSIFSGYWD